MADLRLVEMLYVMKVFRHPEDVKIIRGIGSGPHKKQAYKDLAYPPYFRWICTYSRVGDLDVDRFTPQRRPEGKLAKAQEHQAA